MIKSPSALTSRIVCEKLVLVGEYAPQGGAKRYFEQLIEISVNLGIELEIYYPSNISPSIEFKSTNLNLKVTPVQFLLDHPVLRFLPKKILRNPLTYQLEARVLERQLSTSFNGSFHTRLFSLTSPGRFLGGPKFNGRAVQIHHSYPRGFFHRLAGRIFGRRVSRTETEIIGVSQFLSGKFKDFWHLEGRDSPKTILNTGGEPSIREIAPERMVLAVGIVNKQKAPGRFIRMAQIYLSTYPNDSVSFVWVGAGPLLDKCRRIVSRLGLADRILFVGHSDSVDDFYKKAKVYMQLSEVDSMPLAALDALRFGLPTVVSPRGGLPELVPDDLARDFIVMTPGKVVVELVRRLLDEEVFYQRISREFSLHYKRNFSPRAWRSSFVSVISQ